MYCKSSRVNFRFWVKNIMLSNLNSYYFLEAMPHKSIDKIFLINPDPWVKKRHHKRRLMSYEILSLLNKITKSKNSIYMTTDSSDYLRDTLSLLNEYKDSFGTFSSSILKKMMNYMESQNIREKQ